VYPIIFDLPGAFSINGYGLMLALGFFIGIQLAIRQGEKENIDPALILKLIMWIFVAAIVGSRLLHVIAEEPRKYWEHPLEILYVWRGGYAFYGGFLLSMAFMVIFCKRHELNFLKVADLFAPSVAIGLAFGRMGCFLAGCCYGKEWAHPLAVTFPAETLGKAHMALIPTQTLSSFKGIGIFLLLTYLYPKKRFHGQIFFTFLIVYSIARSAIEFLRDDHRGAFLGNTVSTSQLISILIVSVLLVAFAARRLRPKRVVNS
jgi:phosphatidylglycerol:prolipoprotein diacylglycerol transferase